jgi:hypothetical protein
VAAWQGYNRGYDRADAERRAQVAELHAAHSLALAEAEAEARARLVQATARAAEAERGYLAAQDTIAAQRRELTNRRIADASRDVDVSDGACRFGREWVRLYNEAIGARAGDGGDAVPGTAADADAGAGGAAAADAGILPGAAAVTPEDILAHIRDYGHRCRDIEARLLGLQEWAKGLNGEEPWQ